VRVAPATQIASVAAAFAACHCELGAGLLACDEREVQGCAGRIQVRDVAGDERRRLVLDERPAQRAGDGAVDVLERRPGRSGLERVDEDSPAQQLVAQVGAVEAALCPRRAGRGSERERAVAAQDRSRPCPSGAGPSASAPWRRRIVRARARRRAICTGSPSNPTIVRQPCGWPRAAR
jgi:hypothetical protein